MADPVFDPKSQPDPEGGWSEEITAIPDAIVVPADRGALVQPAGVLDRSGDFCPQGALWRKFRCLNTAPEMPGQAPERLTGRWLWGSALSDGFGLFLLESTARLWALNHLDAPVRGVLFIPKRPRTGNRVLGFQADFMNLIAPGRAIRVATSPLRVEELIVAGQGLGQGKIIRGTQKYRDALGRLFARDIAPDGPDRLYISTSRTRSGRPGLIEEMHLEDLLSVQGYHVFHPQEHDLATQVARYKAATHIVACEGAALHLLALVGRSDQQIAVLRGHQSRNGAMYSAQLEHFCGRSPLAINVVKTDPTPPPGSGDAPRGEIDLTAVGEALSRGGFFSPAVAWQGLTEARIHGATQAQ